MDPEDVMLMNAMDHASALLGCMAPSDYADIRGQVDLCGHLMDTPLGLTQGIRWSFSIQSDTSVQAGGEAFMKGTRSELVWLRETIWQGMLEEGEVVDMHWVYGGLLGSDACFSRTMTLALHHVQADR